VTDDRDFERMYERFRPQVLAYCRRRVTEADAHDATAEVFTTAWRKRDSIPEHSSALPWLYGVARNVLRHQQRGGHRRFRLSVKAGGTGAIAAPTPEQVVVERDEHARIREALGRLSETDREALSLSAWEGLSHAEIATVLGASLAAIDKRLARAKRRLAHQYDTFEAGSPRSRETQGGAA